MAVSIFEQAHLDMTNEELIYRLPGELAIKTLKGRISTAQAFIDLFSIPEMKTALLEAHELKTHFNSLLGSMTDAELAAIPNEIHARLLDWLGNSTKDRIKNLSGNTFSIKLLFNITRPDETEVWRKLFQRIIDNTDDPTQPININYIGRVMDKIDKELFGELLQNILANKDARVRASVLCLKGLNADTYVLDHHKTVALKAYAKVTDFPAILPIKFDTFNSLRNNEKFNVLERYLLLFPKFRHVNVFAGGMPTLDEFCASLFAGSIESNERYNKVVDLYKDIVVNDPPKDETEEDEEPVAQPTVHTTTPIVAPVQTAYVEQLNPSEWYFYDEYLDEEEIETFTFVRKNNEGSWTENEKTFIEQHLVSAGFEVDFISEGVYKANMDLSEQASQYLKQAGFTRKKC